MRSEGTVLGRNVVVDSGAVVEAAEVGEGSVVEVGAVLGRGSIIGRVCHTRPFFALKEIIIGANMLVVLHYIGFFGYTALYPLARLYGRV